MASDRLRCVTRPSCAGMRLVATAARPIITRAFHARVRLFPHQVLNIGIVLLTDIFPTKCSTFPRGVQCEDSEDSGLPQSSFHFSRATQPATLFTEDPVPPHQNSGGEQK